MEFDKYPGPYTLNQFGEWKMLSNYMTKRTIEKIGNHDQVSYIFLKELNYFQFYKNYFAGLLCKKIYFVNCVEMD